MVYLLGRSLSLQKRVQYALRVFDGVGPQTSVRICDAVYIHAFAKVKDLREEQLLRLKEILQPMMEAKRQDRLLKMKLVKNKPVSLQPT